MTCVSMSNEPRQPRPTIIVINSSETHYYPLSVSVNKCSETCNTVDDPYARLCVQNRVKNMNLKVFNLMPMINETIFLAHHELC